MEEEKEQAIVTSIKISHSPLENTYTAIGDKVLQAKSTMPLEIYDRVANSESGFEFRSKGTSEAYSLAMTRLLNKIDIEANARYVELKLEGKEYCEVAIKLMPNLKSAAHILLKGLLSGAPIIVRFHNDGDGSAGAIALYRALFDIQKRFFVDERAISWEMNRSIAYSLESFYADKMVFKSYESIERPILLITDFGTSIESVEAIEEASKVCDIIWLDHHMPYDGFPREFAGSYINVCDFGGIASFTAGLLACIFAQVLSRVDVDDVLQAALVSDYSIYANFKDDEALKNSIILDYLTSSANELFHRPRQLDLILRDKEKSESTFRHASNLLKEAIDTGIKNVKNYKNADGLNIYILDFGHIARLRLDYPLPGRYSSKLQERLEHMSGGKTITLVHYGSYVSIRTSSDIHESINILDIIEKLKAQTGGMVSGGGHRQAASIRTDREHLREVIRLILLEFGVQAQED